jgi:diguanylate cyclase (GGDEF)-like protein/PAS domain S-box-containing protein
MSDYPQHAIDEHAIISITDSLGRITYVNDKMCEISQYDRVELINQDHRIINSHYHSKSFMREMWMMITNGQVWHGKVRNIGKHGSIFWCDTTIVPIKNKSDLIESFFTIRTDITKTKLYEEQLLETTQYDYLTRLPNRFLLGDRLDQTLRKSKRDNLKFAILFIDLDDFKKVNDQFGHEGGDRFLIEVAERMKSCVRASDTISRHGGDEFVILLPDIKEDNNAHKVAEKIIAKMQQVFIIDGTEVVSGASIGIAAYPDNGMDTRALLHNADLAMYKAKQSGKNRHHQFS